MNYWALPRRCSDETRTIGTTMLLSFWCRMPICTSYSEDECIKPYNSDGEYDSKTVKDVLLQMYCMRYILQIIKLVLSSKSQETCHETICMLCVVGSSSELQSWISIPAKLLLALLAVEVQSQCILQPVQNNACYQ